MERINITIQSQGSQLMMTRGTPGDLGLEAPQNHMVLTYSFYEVMLWMVGNLSQSEKQNMVEGVQDYLDTAFLLSM